MPKQPDWLEPLNYAVITDTEIEQHERERRLVILNDIATRVQQDGARVAQPHANRARQFMPFAALKGYHELARERERIHEQAYDKGTVPLSQAKDTCASDDV